MYIHNTLQIGIHLLRKYYGLVLSRRPQNSDIMQIIKLSYDLQSKVFIFCHFDPAGKIWYDTRCYLRNIRAAGYSIIFITNSGKISPDELSFLEKLAACIIIRKNNGYDFAAYSAGVRMLEQDGWKGDCLVLGNDSVYGPIKDISEIFRRLNFGVADVWCLTDSWQHSYHAQSYFLAFGSKVLSTKEFWRYWQDVRILKSKTAVVHYYELGFSRRLLELGFKINALWSYHSFFPYLTIQRYSDSSTDSPMTTPPRTPARSEFQKKACLTYRARIPLNPTHELWFSLLEAGYPFIKKELIQKNPAKVENIFDWHDVIKNQNVEIYEAIIEHLKYFHKKKAP